MFKTFQWNHSPRVANKNIYFASLLGFYCETHETLNTTNTSGMLLCCKGKASQARETLNRTQRRKLDPSTGFLSYKKEELANNHRHCEKKHLKISKLVLLHKVAQVLQGQHSLTSVERPFLPLWFLHKVELFSTFISHLDDISTWKSFMKVQVSSI